VPIKLRGIVGARLGLPKLVRYSAASFVTTLVSLGLLAVLLTGLSAVMANLVAVAVGSVISFELNRRWVWRQIDNAGRWKQGLVFVGTSLAFLGVSAIAVREVGQVHHNGKSLGGTILIEMTTVGAFGLRWVVQYVFLDRVLFRNAASPLN
jgi:putative flippase GtrA